MRIDGVTFPLTCGPDVMAEGKPPLQTRIFHDGSARLGRLFVLAMPRTVCGAMVTSCSTPVSHPPAWLRRVMADVQHSVLRWHPRQVRRGRPRRRSGTVLRLAVCVGH
jgi:hypothetical protein